MGVKDCAGVAFVIAAGLVTTSTFAQSSRPTQAEQDRAALRQFPEAQRAVRDVSPIIDRAARNEAERASQDATRNRAVVTSRDRPADSRLASPAHNRGAVDVVTPNMRSDARNISREAGSGYTVIHEQPNRPANTRGTDTHTSYRGGNQGNTSVNPPRATGEHIHVQPEFNKRLHEAARPAPTPRTEGGVRAPGVSNAAR